MSSAVSEILVIGHRNPDTDAGASATGYAAFLNAVGRYSEPVAAAIPGGLTPQARYVFDQAGIEAPRKILSLKPRVEQVMVRDIECLSVTQRLRDALESLVRRKLSVLPIVNEEGQLHATFSHRKDITRFLLGFDVVPILGSLLDWSDLVAIPGASSVGDLPKDPTLRGHIHFPLRGHDYERDDFTNDDILGVPDVAEALRVPADRRPRWIITLSSEQPSEGAVRELNEGGAFVMCYSGSPSDFVLALLPQIPLGRLDLGIGACVGESDLLSDVKGVIHRSRHAIPVLGSDGSLTGVVSRADLQKPARQRVVLIDHFESSQAVDGLDHAEIVEILDHHRIGDIETDSPLRVDCRPVGSSSTIVAFNFMEAGIEPSREIATVLLGGLLADTLCLRSPTSTDYDRELAPKLAEIAGLDVADFGIEVLRAGDDLRTSEPAEIWNRDQKVFTVRNHSLAVAQLETVSLQDLPGEKLDAFRNELVNDASRRDWVLSVLFITDVLSGDSWLTFVEKPHAEGAVAQCFGTEVPREGWTLARKTVSRKKQIIPPIVKVLSERR
ncbi:MAG: DHH family phosphoesterase [Planctomycetota bacterium]